MFVKICGLKRAEDVIFAVSEGADAVGVIVGVKYKSEDFVSLPLAYELLRFVPKEVLSVLVTHFTETTTINALIDTVKPRCIQLQNEISPEDIAKIRKANRKVRIIKAIHVTGPEAIDLARKYEVVVDYILLDSKTSDRIGGTGQTHDWSISAQIVQEVRAPVILAGGLTPENVREAIEVVKPFGVDVNTGTKGSDGFKDEEKVRAFIRNAKSSSYRSITH